MFVTMLLLFIILSLGLFALLTGFDRRSETARLLRERLTGLETAVRRNPSHELTLLRNELLSDIPALNKLLARSIGISRFQSYLSQAEVKMLAGKFLLLSLCCGTAVAVIINLIWKSALLSLLTAILCTGIPFFYVSMRRSRRFRRFEQLFPEAMDVLARAVRAGHAFNTALEVIAKELAEPVGGEFQKVFDELKFGLPLRDAMLNLVERVPLTDVKLFVTAALLQRETGGNLAEILDKLSYLMRERFKLLRQVRVYTAQGRLTLMILMAIPPGLLLAMSLLRPGFIRPLFIESLGQLMIACGVMLQIVGYLVIRKIIHIKV